MGLVGDGEGKGYCACESLGGVVGVEVLHLQNHHKPRFKQNPSHDTRPTCNLTIRSRPTNTLYEDQVRHGLGDGRRAERPHHEECRLRPQHPRLRQAIRLREETLRPHDVNCPPAAAV